MREGAYNQASVGKMMSDDQQRQMQKLLEETEQRFQVVEKENRDLRKEL